MLLLEQCRKQSITLGGVNALARFASFRITCIPWIIRTNANVGDYLVLFCILLLYLPNIGEYANDDWN